MRISSDEISYFNELHKAIMECNFIQATASFIENDIILMKNARKSNVLFQQKKYSIE